MGDVWAATHTVTRRTVAMKFIKAPVHARPELRRRFLREARAASAVRHPNVVDVLDVFELDADTPVMVMDLLKGETLGRKLAREQKLEIGEAATILLPIVSAVGTAHALGIIHRDLKPDNVFLAESEEGDRVVKVLDFGIAKLSSATEGETGVTQTGATLGTPCYMAPEQATGERQLDHRVDIWALGVILYEALSGVRPIEGDTVGQIVMHLMSTGITPLERIVPELPSDVTALVGRMLARERTRRPEDLREVFDVLRQYTDVRCRTFGAPGSEAQQVSGADLGEVEGSGRHRVIVAADASEDGETVSFQHTRPSTAGPHAVPTESAHKPRSRLVLGGAVLVAAAAAVVLYVFAIGSSPPPPSTPLPTVAQQPALPTAQVPAALGADTLAAAPALAPSASTAPSPAQRLQNTPVATKLSSRAARPVASTTSAPSPAPSAAPPHATPPTAPKSNVGGLAEKPPF